jgi:hypothetical protein
MEMKMQTCARCGQAGKNGAKFVLLVDDEETARVHKFCGDLLAKSAPEGATVKVVHVAEFRALQQELSVRKFWKEKFQKAHARKPSLKAA